MVGLDANEGAERLQETMDQFFALQKELYDTGARCFLFIDVPPIHRAPAGMLVLSPAFMVSYGEAQSVLIEKLLFQPSPTYGTLLFVRAPVPFQRHTLMQRP